MAYDPSFDYGEYSPTVPTPTGERGGNTFYYADDGRGGYYKQNFSDFPQSDWIRTPTGGYNSDEATYVPEGFRWDPGPNMPRPYDMPKEGFFSGMLKSVGDVLKEKQLMTVLAAPFAASGISSLYSGGVAPMGDLGAFNSAVGNAGAGAATSSPSLWESLKSALTPGTGSAGNIGDLGSIGAQEAAQGFGGYGAGAGVTGAVASALSGLGNPSLGDLFKIGAGTAGLLSNRRLSDQLRNQTQSIAEKADPFAPERSQYQDLLSQSYVAPFSMPEDDARRRWLKQAAERAGAQRGINPLHTELALQSQLAAELNTKRQTLGRFAGADINPATGAQIASQGVTAASGLKRAGVDNLFAGLGSGLFGNQRFKVNVPGLGELSFSV